jgi:hypothetical protein
MRCPICQSRQAKRKCPARGDVICAVCCATKRLVEIRCPEDCGYLTAARQHPAAVTQRQREHDMAMLWPALAGLTERQSHFFFLFQSIAVRQPSDPLRPLVDADVADAAASLATSLETSSRGVIYEQAPTSLPAQALASDLRRAFDEIAAQAGGPRSPLERDAARALKGIEEAARRVGPLVGYERRGFLDLLERVLAPPAGTARSEDRAVEPSPGSIILP